MTAIRGYFLLALVGAALLVGHSAAAHPAGLSRGEYVVTDGTIFAGVTFARRELAAALPWLRSTDDDASLLAFEQQRDRLGQWLIDRLTASEPEGRCWGAFDGMRFDGDAVALALSYRCPKGTGPFELDARFVSDLDRGHHHVAAMTIGEVRFEAVATQTRSIVSFERPTSEPATSETTQATAARTRSSTTPSTWASFVRMGVEHILTGYDHLLFLIGLVLIGGPVRSLFAAVTAFTVAHSITLGVASLGGWAPSPGLVEPCIALSIAYVGVENWFVRDARGRFRVTFLFGLVHGFGFATALREVALPRSEIPAALFAFNCGVEVGQLAVLSAILPLIWFARKQQLWDRFGMRACTAAIALAGVAWFIVRVRGSL